MKLLFLYVEDFRIHQKRSFNFDSNERFLFENGVLRRIDSQNVVSDDFFYEVQTPSLLANRDIGRVDSVSAIIGENGTGKTSLAELLNIAFSRGRKDCEFLYVLKIRHGKGVKYICRENRMTRSDVTRVRDAVGEKCWDYAHVGLDAETRSAVGMIYFSPYYSPRDEWFIGRSDGFVDLSTIGLFRNKTSKEYDLEETNRIDRIMKKFSRRMRLFKADSPLPAPGGMELEINVEYISSVQRHCAALMNRQSKGRVAEYEPLAWNQRGDVVSYVYHTDLHFGEPNCFHYLEDGLDIAKSGDPLIQVVAGLMALCYEAYDYGEALPPDAKLLLVRVADIGHAIADKLRQLMGSAERAPFWMLAKSVCEMPREKLLEWRRFAVACVNAVFASQTFSTAGARTAHNSEVLSFGDCISSAERLGFGAVGRLVETFLQVFEIAHYDGERYLIKLNSRKQQRLYYQLKAEFEVIWTKLFRNGEGRFFTVKPKGMSSGEMAYLSLFARLDECLEPDRLSGRRRLNRDLILFLDEAETTLHPEWQRRLVESVIWYFENFTTRYRVHVLFASHSPTLLSDVPAGNVCMLPSRQDKSNGVPTMPVVKTFGLNVYDLYRRIFSADDGIMGRLAQRRIGRLLEHVSDHVALSDEEKKLAELIGDEVIAGYVKKALRVQTLRDNGAVDY